MIANPKTIPENIAEPAAVRAADHLWNEILRAKAQRAAANNILVKYTETLELLVDGLPVAQRAIFQKRLEDLKREVSPDTQRLGEVSGNVIELFRRDNRKEWNFSDVQNKLSQEGTNVEAKAVYNTLNYLVKAGVLERIARGRYRLRKAGLGLEADGLPDDGTTRMSEHY